MDNNHIARTFTYIAEKSKSIVSTWEPKEGDILEKTNIQGRREVVSVIDRQIEELARKVLEGDFPDWPVVGEEAFTGNFNLLDSVNYFVIDPIDGTAQFVKGGDEWAISLCAVHQHQPVVGLLYFPRKRDLLLAIKGRGVWLNDDQTTFEKPVVDGIAVSPRQIQLDEFSARVKNTGMKHLHVSSFTPKIHAIATGKASAATYFPQEGKSAKLWDYAAACVVMKELGGNLTSLTGEQLPFKGRGIIHENGWLATSKRTNHDKLLKMLATL